MLEWESCHAKSHMDTVCPRYLEVHVKIPGDLQHIAEKKLYFLLFEKPITTNFKSSSDIQIKINHTDMRILN